MKIMLAFARAAALSGALAVALTGCTTTFGTTQFKRVYTSRVSAAGAQRLVITSDNGDVTATAADVPAIVIHATVETDDVSQLDRDKVSVTRSGGDVTVATVCGGRANFVFWSIQNCGADYQITYPKSLRVSVTSVNGDVLVIDGAAPVEAQTTNGDITIRAASSDVTAESHQGDVVASLAASWKGTRIDMQTTFGDVRLSVPDGFHGGVDAHTLAGDVDGASLLHGGPPTADLSTTFGDVDIRHTPS